MILPIVLVATNIVFFVWVMVVNWHEDVWKSSPLPVIFFGLDQSTREALVEDLGDEATVQRMEDTVASVKVNLNGTDNVPSMRSTRNFRTLFGSVECQSDRHEDSRWELSNCLREPRRQGMRRATCL